MLRVSSVFFSVFAPAEIPEKRPPMSRFRVEMPQMAQLQQKALACHLTSLRVTLLNNHQNASSTCVGLTFEIFFPFLKKKIILMIYVKVAFYTQNTT